MKEKPIEVITPPNMLKAKVGGKLAAMDPDAIRRAEQALTALSGQFGDWIQEEIGRLDAALQEAKRSGVIGKPGDDVFRVAHDLKGLGSTYEFPLVTRMMGSLCKLFELHEDARENVKLGLVAAHVQAAQAAVRDNIRTDEHPVGRALVEELERLVLATAA